ncbi:MAG: polyisoprenyl-teichoic acid--peptidoglycan teichoic acid transferase [Actinomycetota bacterium]|nr:polyisoprenyl-teichoic acid--peptidoglycan teichoic acid transferase [Actinomycetota bacterium]
MSDAPTVPLPESGDGTRRRRRLERRSTGRRSITMVVAVVVGMAVVAGIAWVIVGFARGGSGPADRARSRPASSTSAGPGPALVVLTNAAGDVYGITVLAPAAGTIIHVPPGTLVEVASVGLASLRDAKRDGGVALLQHSLENVLGVRFAAVVELKPGDLSALAHSVGSLAVSVGHAVEERAASGRVTVVVPAGRQTLAPDGVEAFLEVVGTGTSLDRLVRHQAFWSAYLTAIRTSKPAPVLGPVGVAVAALAKTDVTHQVLPVEAVSGVSGDEQLYRLVERDLASLVAKSFPGAATRAIRIQVLNGAGVPGIAQRVQPLLVDAGGRVTLSGNADRFDYPRTQIVYYADARLNDAKAIRSALGVGEIVKSLTGLNVVDVTVVVGADFLVAHPGG